MKHLKKILIILLYIFLIVLFILSPQSVIKWDESLFLMVNSLSNFFMDYFLLSITILGSSILWILVIILLWFKGKRDLSIHLFYAFLIDSLFLIFLKFGFERPRPIKTFQNFLIDYDMGPSFPSGHTQRAFSEMIILSSYYGKFKYLFLVLSFLVGLSRIYLGFHYPLDVLIGVLNGVVIGSSVLCWPTKELRNKLKNFFKTIQKQTQH